MVKKRLKPFVLPTIYLSLVVMFLLLSFVIIKSFEVANNIAEKDYTYVSNEVIMNNSIPVIKEDNLSIIKPFTDNNVAVGKSFYDYTKDSIDQESSIIYYEDTYIQNSGVDYVSKEPFNCLAVLSGEVISVTEDDIVGKTVKIRHDNELISVYQSLSEVSVLINEIVTKGQIIGMSGTNDIGSNLGNHLHFELVHKNVIVDPESYYGITVGE